MGEASRLLPDSYFQEVLQQNSSCNEVTLHKDGSWTPLMPKKEQKEPEVEKRKPEVAVETLSDDSDDCSTEQDDGECLWQFVMLLALLFFILLFILLIFFSLP